MRRNKVKENQIGPAVSEILSYRQTHRHPLSIQIYFRGVSGLERNVVWRSDKGHISAATADRVHLEPSSTGGIDLVFRYLSFHAYSSRQGQGTRIPTNNFK